MGVWHRRAAAQGNGARAQRAKHEPARGGKHARAARPVRRHHHAGAKRHGQRGLRHVARPRDELVGVQGHDGELGRVQRKDHAQDRAGAQPDWAVGFRGRATVVRRRAEGFVEVRLQRQLPARPGVQARAHGQFADHGWLDGHLHHLVGQGEQKRHRAQRDRHEGVQREEHA